MPRTLTGAHQMGDMGVKLMTKEIKKQIPVLGGQDGKGIDAIVYVKWFNPAGPQTWWITEYDPNEEIAFGYVQGMYDEEWGTFILHEIQNVRVPILGLGIERDLYFTPKPLRECLRSTCHQGSCIAAAVPSGAAAVVWGGARRTAPCAPVCGWEKTERADRS